jgi:PAS domain-containing protein
MDPCGHSYDPEIIGREFRRGDRLELSAILDAVVEGVCGLDGEGNATFCNKALARMTGYRVEEIVGKNRHELVHHSRPDGTRYPAEECAFRKAVAAHEVANEGSIFRFLNKPCSKELMARTITAR